MAITQPVKRISLVGISNKSALEIKIQLGKPTQTGGFVSEGQTCACHRMGYLNNQVFISYINGKSDWIWIKPSISILNEKKAKTKALHRFKQFTFIKCNTIESSGCCNSI
jgi:hypothetical protein